MDLKKIRRIYFIGIKGSGMTALAQILHHSGKKVWGSDVPETFFTDEVLKKEKIKVIEKFSTDNITKDIDLVVYSTVYNENNIEFKTAKAKKLKMLSYPEALGLLFKDKFGIAVCGSHGKTTTTAMLSFVLQELGQRPSAIIGSAVEQLGGSCCSGSGKYLVVEADEYQNKLRYYNPRTVILTAADLDHPDYFKNQQAYNKVFKDFVKRIPKKGFLVAFSSDKNVCQIIKSAECRVIKYDKGRATDEKSQGVGALIKLKNGVFIFQKRDFKTTRNPGMIAPFGGGKNSGESSFAALKRELKEELNININSSDARFLGQFKSHVSSNLIDMFYVSKIVGRGLKVSEGAGLVQLSLGEALKNAKVTKYTKEVINYYQNDWLDLKIPGNHNLWNAWAVLAVVEELGLDVRKAKKILEKFSGTKRRFELLGKVKGVAVYDDYAHHPVEVEKVLLAARQKFPTQKIWAIFQPHTYSRTEAFFEDFAKSFKNADQVIILDIFGSAREQAGKVRAADLVKAINRHSHNAFYRGKIKEVVDYLVQAVKKGDIVLVIGAGENWKVGRGLVVELKKRR